VIMRRIVKIIGIVVVVYFLVAIGFYLFQDDFVFQSDFLPGDYAFVFDQKFEEYAIPTNDGDTLNALFFNATVPAKGLILYFHGNAGNLQRWGKCAVDFTALGYDVLMIDYRGYGKSSGTPSEMNLYKDANTTLEWSQYNFPRKRLIFYGRSLGAAVAAHLALSVTPDLLILETPFDELKGAVFLPLKPLLYLYPLRYKFSNKMSLQRVSCKKLIIQGTNDWVVPLSAALKLKPLLHDGDAFITIAGGSHNNLREFDEYHKILAEWLN